MKQIIQQSLFHFFSKWLKLSNFLIFKGKYLYNLTPTLNTLTWNKVVLQNCVCKSYLLLVLCSWITKFCFRFPLYFFMKHKTLKTYSEVNVRILFSLNFCLQDSYFLIPVINQLFFNTQYLYTFSCSSPKHNAISQSRLKTGEVNILKHMVI